jgi:GT2 family glycosyltransferase
MRASSLSVSIVSFDPDLALLAAALGSLAASIRQAQAGGQLGDASVTVLDNGPQDRFSPRLDELSGSAFADVPRLCAAVLATGANPGYGAANNIAIRASEADYHLVLNPDVILAEDALACALRYMESHRETVLLSPLATGSEGERQYLCKHPPGLWTLFLRGFAPAFVRRRFDRSLRQYEMREETGNGEYAGRFLVSGCFMFMRGDALRAAGGFDPAYFMYFEDYDLSLRLARQGSLAFVPAVKIVHHGGGAAAKGWRHRIWFLRSALRFFNSHGWRFV